MTGDSKKQATLNVNDGKVEAREDKEQADNQDKKVQSESKNDEAADGEGSKQDEKKRKASEDDRKDTSQKEIENDDKPPQKAAKTEKNASQAERKISGKDQGTVGSQQDSVKWQVMERGHVYFFYRPKVQPASERNKDEPAATSIDSVQNTHMLLLPRASDSDTAPAKAESTSSDGNKSERNGEKARSEGIGARLVRLGKKRLPDPSSAIAQGDEPGGIGGDASETIWAVISDVAKTFEALKDGFQAREYSTKTSGQRVVQGARVAGRGWYTISESLSEPPSSREVRISYVLSHPSSESEFGDVQKELGIRPESSFTITMRNPTLPSTGAGAPPAGLDPSSRVELSSEEINETFGGKADGDGTRYARPENLDLLDRAGVELLLIKKKEQEQEDAVGLGETQKAAIEKLAGEEGEKLSNEQVIQKELQLQAKDHPPDALDGDWV
ncbi:unnamed protein product [Sympodiomycopsis kandeliae]